MKFSANIGFLFAELPLVERIRAAHRGGFGAVEMHWPYETPASAVREVLAETGLPVLGINTPVGDRPGDFGLAGLRGREDEFRQAFQKSLNYAEAIGAAAIHCMAGVGDPDDGAVAFRANLDHAARLAGAKGITILIEPINQRDKPGYMLRTTGQALDVIRNLGHANLKLMFDCYHVQVAEGDVTRRIETALPWIGHVQIAACPSRHEPDEGELHYPYVLSHLEVLSYDGWVGAEYRPRGRTEEGLSWLRNWTLQHAR